jgi:phosphohistidine phosphatase SixA
MHLHGSIGQKILQEIYGGEEELPHIRMWVSPYKRTRETANLVYEQARDCTFSLFHVVLPILDCLLRD